MRSEEGAAATYPSAMPDRNSLRTVFIFLAALVAVGVSVDLHGLVQKTMGQGERVALAELLRLCLDGAIVALAWFGLRRHREIVDYTARLLRRQHKISLKNRILAGQLATSPDGILLTDAAGKIITCNRRLIEMLQLPVDNVHSLSKIAHHLTGLVHSPEVFAAAFNRLINSANDNKHLEAELKNGVRLDVSWLPNREESGQSHGRVWYFRDITADRQPWDRVDNQRRQLQQQFEEATTQLHEQQIYLDRIIASIHDALFVLKPDGTIRYANSYAATMFGYEINKLQQMHFSRMLGSQEEMANIKQMRQLFEREEISNRETSFFHKEGKEIETLFSGGLVRGDSDCLNSIVCVLKDISEIREKEKELEQLQTQIIHADRLSSLGEMATGIAHEINQPLTVIRLGSQFLQKKAAKREHSEQEEKTLREIINQVDRAATIITNMRSFARANKDVANSVELASPINMALSFFKEQFRLHDIVLNVTLDSQLPMVKVDPQKFQQIVVNFLSNARYAVGKKREDSAGDSFQPEVGVRLYQHEDSRVVFEVVDNGIGMSDEERQRCLEPFFTTKEVGKGTGLGLSIIHNLVKEFDGTIEIDSQEGQGSCFRILLPQVSEGLCL